MDKPRTLICEHYSTGIRIQVEVQDKYEERSFCDGTMIRILTAKYLLTCGGQQAIVLVEDEYTEEFDIGVYGRHGLERFKVIKDSANER